MIISYIHIPQYSLGVLRSGAYRYDAVVPKDLNVIVSPLDDWIRQTFSGREILVRCVQSAHYGMTKEDLIARIQANGSDTERHGDEPDIYAAYFASFDAAASLVGIFEGFHRYKPKCDEVPQELIDTIIIYDATAFESVTYLHPRHKVVAKDAYVVKNGTDIVTPVLAICQLS